jgi:hypothetical protein
MCLGSSTNLECGSPTCRFFHSGGKVAQPLLPALSLELAVLFSVLSRCSWHIESSKYSARRSPAFFCRSANVRLNAVQIPQLSQLKTMNSERTYVYYQVLYNQHLQKRSASVDSNELGEQLSPLESAFTKNRERAPLF